MAKAKELTKQVRELHMAQVEEMKALEEQREIALQEEKYDEAATETKRLYDSYIRAGFTAEQAWELITIIMTNSTKRTLF